MATIAERDAKIAAQTAEIEQLKHPKISFAQRASLQIIRLTFPRDPFEPGKPIYINFFFKNTGPIPAEKVVAFCQIAIVRSSAGLTPLDEIELQNEEHRKLAALATETARKKEYGTESVMPGSEKIATGIYPSGKKDDIPLTKEQIEQIKSRTKAIAIAGVLKYIDEYGPRETHFCNTFHGPNPQANWADCCCHNEIVSLEA